MNKQTNNILNHIENNQNTDNFITINEIINITISKTHLAFLNKLVNKNQINLDSLLVTFLYHVLNVYNLNSKINFLIYIPVSKNKSTDLEVIPLIFEYNANDSILDNIKKAYSEIIFFRKNVNDFKTIDKKTSNFIKENKQVIPIIFTTHTPPNINKVNIKHYISIITTKSSHKLFLNIQYNNNTNTSLIANIFNTYKIALQNIKTSGIHIPFNQLVLLSSNNYKTLLYNWNKTDKPYPDNKTIHELFEEQVKTTPNSIAVAYEDIRLTYKEINERANQLANYLKLTYQVKGDDLIGLLLNRNEYMLIAILGVLKSGGAYVPMDPRYPDYRIEYILDDTKAKVLLTHEEYKSRLITIIKEEKHKNHIELIDNKKFQLILSKNIKTNPKQEITSRNLAYVIYTSGTTGKPKGVMIEHHGVINLISNMIKTLKLSRKSRVAQFTSYVFDASVFEIFPVLVTGGILNILSKNLIENSDSIASYFIQNKITHSFFPTAYYKEIYQSLEDTLLKFVYIGGESINGLKDISHKYKLLNQYGPTEITVCATQSFINDLNHVYIGKPIINSKVYILDNNLNPLPLGAIGELHIGGVGLARGYLNLPELTKNRFIANPFQSNLEKLQGKNARIYKTGDLVRYLSDGNIEYIGRNDSQVKIRGFRIELEEIENKLSAYPQIKQSVVLVNEQKDNKYLVGYYVADRKVNEKKLLKYLNCNLPEYMVPSVLVFLEKLPLTINGKIDRQALLKTKIANLNNYVAPINDLEAQICEVYAKVLDIRVSAIGTHDNFFKLGGNSIIAIKLVNKLNDQLAGFGYKVTVPLIYKYPTIAKMLPIIIDANHIDKIDVIPKLDFNTNSSVYKLSFSQERLWFIENYESGTNAYNIPLLNKLSPNIDISLLEKSLHSTVERHEILHSLIKTDIDGNNYQQVYDLKQIPLIINKHLYTNKLSKSQIIQSELDYIFKLAIEYPIRISILEQQNTQNKYLLILVHHIAFDGWSVDIFLRDLQTYYDYYLQLKLDRKNNTTLAKLNLPKLSIQYKDFAVWQKSYLMGDRLNSQLNYWIQKLKDFPVVNLPVDKPRPSQINYAGDKLLFTINKKNSFELRELAKQLHVSLYSVLLGGFYLLLRAYSNQDDLVIGTPIANRHHEQLENLVGFFVNNLVLRSIINPELKLNEYIKNVGRDIIEAQLHQDLPFEKIVNELDITQDTSRHPIFQIMFVVQSFGTKTSESVNNLFDGNLQSINYKIAKFDLNVFIDDSEPELSVIFNYATALFIPETIERFMSTYILVLDQICLNPNLAIKNLKYLNNSDYDKITKEWNKTDIAYPNTKTIHQLFLEQVKKTPNNIAVIDAGSATKYSYKDLNGSSNLLARYLVNQHSKLIGVMVEKGYPQVVSTIAIMKSGNAYLPLNIDLPINRIDDILINGNVKTLIVSRQLIKCENFFEQIANKYELLVIEDILAVGTSHKTILSQKNKLFFPKVSSNDIAYVIFTSGSTGKPKGVTISHKGVINTIIAINKQFNVNSTDIILALSDLNFDLSVYDLFGLLFVGGTVVFPEQPKVKDPEHWIDLIKKYKITIWNSVPQLADLFINELAQTHTSILSLRLFLLSGDWIPLTLPDRIKQSCNNPLVISLGGATEGSIWSIWYEINKIDKLWNSIPYGTPMPNQKIYILDTYDQLTPIGVTGEIHIGGDGVALNYWGDEEKTNSSFFQHNILGRLYRTGDLGRWNQNGYVEFLGRKDFQVKIRGYRIELGEIENKLASYPNIKQSLVSIYENNGNKYLVGYYVSDHKLAKDLILTYLNNYLPNYMIPNALVWLEKLPLTPNGKLDQQSLPTPHLTNSDSHVSPKTDLENKVCEIFAQVLNLETHQIGIEDKFFKIGGNSLMVVQLKHQLNKLREFANISVADIFKYDSVQKLVSSTYKKSINKPTDYQLQNFNPTSNFDIAIIGASGAFSGASSVTEFWDIIQNQQEGIKLYSKEECEKIGISQELLSNPNYIRASGFIKDIDLFDPAFWGISANEAKQTDPQIRKFIEHCWYVLEQAGYITLRHVLNIGIFAGSGNNQYLHENILKSENINTLNLWEISQLNSKDALATRAAYLLGLTGPAYSINTTCSTGLITVVDACQKLAFGACNLAIAGGVYLSMPERIGYIYEDGMILSNDGHCRTFDRKASGTIPGSGVGVVLLKRLDDAIRDKDNILAVIKGYASNNDGARKTSYTAPSVIGQTECILNAQLMARIKAHSIDYIECHGTATHLGDTIEVQALKEAFITNSDKEQLSNHKCVLGAVKANIGHTDSAAGIAGLIKVCCMLQHNLIPAQINYTVLNPELNLEPANFEIVTKNRKWKHNPDKPRIAGVSSFGIGGTNAHVIVTEYIDKRAFHSHSKEKNNLLFPISAKSRKSLELYKQALVQYLKHKPLIQQDLANVAYTLQTKREIFNYRCCINAHTVEGLIESLINNSQYSHVTEDAQAKIIFMFPGQGTQYANMGVDLYLNDQLFKNLVDKNISIANQFLEINLNTVLYPSIYPPEKTIDINQTQWSQISLLIISYSLSQYLNKLGIHADAYIGHSLGEYVAAIYAGVFSLEDAIKLVIVRGKLMQKMQRGSMLSVQASFLELSKIIDDFNCEIALMNAPENIVVSGLKKNIKNLKQYLDKNGIPSIQLETSHAYHSSMMEKAAIEFRKEFANITLQSPIHKFISTIDGIWVGNEVATPNYWCNQLINPVKFSQGIQTIATTYSDDVIFLEVGVGKALTNFVKKHNKRNGQILKGVQLLPSLKEYQEHKFEVKSKEDILKVLWENGILNGDLTRHVDSKSQNSVYDLPTYQFDSKSYWIKKSILPNQLGQNKISFNQINIQDQAQKISIFEEKYTELEYKVAKIFCEILGTTEISIHDNFFDLGGNSLLSIRLVSKIKNLGVNFTIQDILNRNSVAQICNTSDKSDVFSILLPLKINNPNKGFTKNKNVFLIHAVGGTIMIYNDMVRKLPTDYNYFGIQNINIYGDQLLKVKTFEELCSIYLKEILKVQNEGEYILCGSSMGGTLAYEIGYQLQKIGKTVKFIAMFDAWATFAKEFAERDRFEKKMSELKQNIDDVDFENSDIANMMKEARWGLMKLLLAYTPKASDLNIHLFKAKILDDMHIMNKKLWDNGWQQYTTKPISVNNITGDHVTIHIDKGLEEICTNLSLYLTK